MRDATWAHAACARTKHALSRHRSIRAVSGLWATSATRYDEVELPAGFVTEVVDADGARRRVARSTPSPGEPVLVIVPGLFASLSEKLFVDVARLAQRAGRNVIVIEDRFAAPTLALNGGAWPSAARLGAELASIVRTLSAPPDVLAFSSGALSALFVPAPVRRMVIWSAAFRPAAVLAHASRSFFVRRYFDSIRRRAFRSASRSPLSWRDIVEMLGDGEDDGRAHTRAPLLLVHAEDDPVAPVSEVLWIGNRLAEGQAVCITKRGGHLGFGALAGDDVYLAPLVDGVEPARGLPDDDVAALR